MFLEDPDKSGARTLFYDTILYLGFNPGPPALEDSYFST